MRKNLQYHCYTAGFTLAELMVVMAIIGILALVTTSLDFTRLNIRQDVNIEINSLESTLTEVRNNALIGKGIGSSLSVPDYWSIFINNVSSGSVNVIASGSLYSSWEAPENMELQDIICKDIIGQSDSTNNATITFTGSKIDITSGCTHSTRNYKILSLVYGQGSYTGSVSINTITGVITRNNLP